MTTSDARATRLLDAQQRLTSPDGGPLLALSPHLDDVVFSACTPVLARPLEVWTVFAGEPDEVVTTDWDRACGFADARATLAARRDEDEAAFAGTQVTLRHLAHLDGPYTAPPRRAADLADFRAEVGEWLAAHPTGTILAPACAGVQVKPALWERFRRAPRSTSATTAAGEQPPAPAPAAPPSREAGGVTRLLRRGMHLDYRRRRAAAQRKGLAVNNDHLAVRDVVLEATMSWPGATVVLYEDLPYLWSQPADAQVADLAHRGFRAAAFSVPVDVDEKFRRVQAYASQVDLMDPTQRRLSQPGHLPARERFWVLERAR